MCPVVIDCHDPWSVIRRETDSQLALLPAVDKARRSVTPAVAARGQSVKMAAVAVSNPPVRGSNACGQSQDTRITSVMLHPSPKSSHWAGAEHQAAFRQAQKVHLGRGEKS